MSDGRWIENDARWVELRRGYCELRGGGSPRRGRSGGSRSTARPGRSAIRRANGSTGITYSVDSAPSPFQGKGKRPRVPLISLTIQHGRTLIKAKAPPRVVGP